LCLRIRPLRRDAGVDVGGGIELTILLKDNEEVKVR
jgi:hypothetical protein